MSPDYEQGYKEGARSELASLEVLLSEIHDVPEELDVAEGIDWLAKRCQEAHQLLRAAYAVTHPEEVPVEVLRWLNP